MFQKLKSNVGETVSLVPQKSITDQNEKFKSEVPLSSVLITLFTSMIFIVCLAVLLLPIGMEPERFVILITYGVLQVPLITGLTAKIEKNKVEPSEMNGKK